MDIKKLYLTLISSFIIGIFILIGTLIIGHSIKSTKQQEQRYELITRESEIVIFDKYTGEYYVRFDSSN